MDLYEDRCNTLFIRPKVRIPELKHEAIKIFNAPIKRWEMQFIRDRPISITIMTMNFHSPKPDVIFRIRYRYYNLYTMDTIGYRLKIRCKYEDQHIPLGKLRVLNFKRRY